MSLAPGTRLGPYEIVSAIGAGGMGEVYRAKDPRLGREVAVKVLPASFSKEPERLRRFEQEARAAGALNHPNVTAVLDIGSHDGAPYVVQELLEGETLRALLAGGKLAPRRAVEYALQVLRGLAAAHEKGIVHRDLKPENLFVTRDGRVKILDFGLARVVGSAAGGEATDLPTETHGTGPGVVLGTLGYMAPEQVKGQPADARSDLFAFGAILYEMLAGRRPFRGDSAAETMSAILREDPPDLSATNQAVGAGLERIVRHCLEKSPEQRFHSAHDVAFDLEMLSGTPGASTGAVPGRGKRRILPAALLALLIAGAVVAAWLGGRRAERASRPAGAAFEELTFRPQTIFNARFAPDGRTVVYSAAASGNVPDLFAVSADSPEPRLLQRGAHLLAVSRQGELAVLTGTRYMLHNVHQGTLARMPLGGGAPREVLENVREADWSPDGQSFAVIREVGGRDRLEFPVGKVLCEAGGYFSDLRVSPRGDLVAFFEHPQKWDDRGLAAVVDLQGKKTVLEEGFWGAEGLSWSAGGEEVLFSAGNTYSSFSVHAVTLSGRRRVALQSAGGLTIHDVRADGRWLATRDDQIWEMPVLVPGESAERDLSWLDASNLPIVSEEGKIVIFTEQSGRAGTNYAACLRRTDGSPVVRLGDGDAYDLSRDGKWVAAVVPSTPQQLVVYPTGAGEIRRLDRGTIESYESVVFFPDGRSVLACGHEPGRASRCWVQDIAGGAARPLTPEGTTKGIVSPDGQRIVVRAAGTGLVLYPVSGGEGRPVPGTAPEDEPIRWTSDGRAVHVFRGRDVPLRIERVDVASGRREVVRTLGPSDLNGVTFVNHPYVTGDGRGYAYVFSRTFSHLYLVEGAR